MVLAPAARRPFTVLVSVLLTALTFLAIRSEINDNRIEHGAHNLCAASARSAAGINRILDTLIVSVSETNSIPPSERAVRVDRYTKAKVPAVDCATP